MRGIVLAGGSGTRLRPITRGVCKQLLPVFDKPMVYYPLANLFLAGVREVLVISTPDDLPSLRRLLGDGSAWGARFAYAVQDAPRGIAEALLIGERFLDGAPCALVLGDNLVYGHGLTEALQRGAALREGALIFGTPVADPRRYGVLAFDGDQVVDIVEKPAVPPSRMAVPGLYFYGPDAPARAARLTPSARGELEITDLNRSYLADRALQVHLFGRGVAWLDMGTPESLASASAFVETLQARQGLRIGSPDEVAWRQGWIDDEGLLACARACEGTGYGDDLAALVRGGAVKVTPLGLPGVLQLDAPVFPDARGFFTEVHHHARYAAVGVPAAFVQTNHSRSLRGVLRGLHYQVEHPQGKLLSVVRGAIWDVIADIRPGSPTFGQWTAVEVHEGTGRQLWIPAGYAHGFVVLSEVADVLYACTDVWHPGDAKGVIWDDPTLAIPWPVARPSLSPADAAWPALADAPPGHLPRWTAP